MRPGLREAEYFDIMIAGQYIGIIRPIAEGMPTRSADAAPAVEADLRDGQTRHDPAHQARRTVMYFDKHALDEWMRSGAAQTCHNSKQMKLVLR